MINANELFQVTETSPAVFANSKQVSLYYVLTLILNREGEDLLYLTTPGFVPLLPYDPEDMETVIQVSLSDLLVNVFFTQPFWFIGNFLRQLKGIRQFSSPATAPLKNMLMNLRTEQNAQSSLLFMGAMHELAGISPERRSDRLLSAGSQNAALKIAKIKKFVMENFRRPIRIGEIAGVVGLAPNSFSNFFTRRTGMHFCNYVISVRIAEAVRLLQTSDDSIVGISQSCGFSSPAYFNNQFKQYQGSTPKNSREIAFRRSDFSYPEVGLHECCSPTLASI